MLPSKPDLSAPRVPRIQGSHGSRFSSSGKLILDWREKQQARAGVIQTIKLGLRKLPPPYTKDVSEEKQARAYAHVYDHYFGAGQSVYQPTATT